jgi:hypothetical protein
MENKGYIMLSRRFFANPLWVEPREYSRAEAWLDLIQAAGIEERVIILDGRAIESRRGELAASRRFLENRWRWSAGKVTRFLDMLKSQGMIETRKEHGQTVIRLCNYDTYNPLVTDRHTGEKTSDEPRTEPHNNIIDSSLPWSADQSRIANRTNREPDANQTRTKKKELKKEIKETPTPDGVGGKKDAATAATNDRKKVFHDSLVPYVATYGREMIRDFYAYWAELNRSGTKMRYELQPTWELGIRLSTWARREKEKNCAKREKEHESLRTDTKTVGRPEKRRSTL